MCKIFHDDEMCKNKAILLNFVEKNEKLLSVKSFVERLMNKNHQQSASLAAVDLKARL